MSVVSPTGRFGCSPAVPGGGRDTGNGRWVRCGRVIYGVRSRVYLEEDRVARDPDAIQREIEKTRDALAETLDELSTKADPKRFVEQGKAGVQERLNDPRVRYVAIGVGALVAVIVVRKIFR